MQNRNNLIFSKGLYFFFLDESRIRDTEALIFTYVKYAKIGILMTKCYYVDISKKLKKAVNIFNIIDV